MSDATSTDTGEDDESPGPDDAYRSAFLLGAGASVAAGVPTTVKFVGEFEKWLAKEDSEAAGHLALLLAPLRTWADERNKLADVELLYQVLAALADPDPGFLLERLPAGLRVLTAKQADDLARVLEHFIRKTTFVSQDAVEYLEPLWHFLTPGAPLEVYSTNYDTCIEQVCERLRLRWQDGFELHWDPGVFGRGTDEINLRKLHGSVMWVQDEEGTYFRVPLRPTPDPRSPLMGLAGPCTPLIAYPGRKQSYEAPFVDALVALQKSLGQPQDRVLLIVIGYSFRDDHLLQILFDCARRNRCLRVVLVDPEAERIYQERLAVIPFHGTRRRSPLAGRVTRVCLPVDKRLKVLDTLRARLDRLEYALWAEERQRSYTPNAASWWQGVTKEFFTAGDLPSVYKYGPQVKWSGWQEHPEIHAQVVALLKEVELLILCKARPPKARGLSQEAAKLCENPLQACMVSYNGQYYMVSISSFAGNAVSPSSLRSIFRRALRRANTLASHPVIGEAPPRGRALREFSVLLRRALSFLRHVDAASQRGANPEELLEPMSPGTTAAFNQSFGGPAGSPERAVAWQDRLKERIAEWRDDFVHFVGEQSWAEYDL